MNIRAVMIDSQDCPITIVRRHSLKLVNLRLRPPAGHGGLILTSEKDPDHGG
jgi:hypothetical protein